jgi:adenosylmethionine-8-amino-7-oxononanoate aminotransferase
VETIPPPSNGNEKKCFERLKKILDTHDDIAAIIFEPLVMGAGGMIMYSPESLDEIISLCKEHDILCIADEVMTGFGRTGKMFACEHLKNKVDIMAVSKGITGGSMALGVTLCQQHIYDAFLSDNKLKAFFHGHSYTANPLACSASIASLELFEKEETLKKINTIYQCHEGFITELKKFKNAENIRLRGTILAFDLVTDQKTSYFNNVRDKAYRYFLDQRVLLRPLGNVIYIMPPYCITKSELRYVYDTILNMLSKI